MATESNMRMIKIGVAILLMFACAASHAKPVICNSERNLNYGKPANFQLKESLTFEAALSSHLQSYINEVQRVLALPKEYRGPEKEHVPRLLELMSGANQSAGYTCLWGTYAEGHDLRIFQDNEDGVRRQGLVVLKDGVILAYLYTQIVEV